MRFLAVFLALAAATQARAEGIDRDSLLSEAPAVPDKGTVRISGGATGTSDDGGVGGTQGQGNVAGSISWTPIQNLSGDVGAYWQVGANGPTARIRYQFLIQFRHGLDVSAGARFETVGLHPDQCELEFLVLAWQGFVRLDLVLNGVVG